MEKEKKNEVNKGYILINTGAGSDLDTEIKTIIDAAILSRKFVKKDTIAQPGSNTNDTPEAVPQETMAVLKALAIRRKVEVGGGDKLVLIEIKKCEEENAKMAAAEIGSAFPSILYILRQARIAGTTKIKIVVDSIFSRKMEKMTSHEKMNEISMLSEIIQTIDMEDENQR